MHIPLGDQLLVKVVQQQGNTVPLHLAALVVKVEMMVLDIDIVQSVDVLLECDAHGSLVTLLVDKVDHQLGSIKLLLGLKVLAEGVVLRYIKMKSGQNSLPLMITPRNITLIYSQRTYSLGVIKNFELGGILDVVNLSPVDGDGSTGLNMGEDDLSARQSRGGTIQS